MRRRANLLVVIGIVLGGGGLLLTRQPARPDRAQAAADVFEEIRPHLETVLRARVSAPRFTADAGDDPELSQWLQWQFPELQPEARREAQAAVQAGLPNLVRFGNGAIHVLPPRGLDLHPANAAMAHRLDLVFETARFLLEQRHGLERRWAACRDAEEFQALEAVVEGRAMWLTWQVASRLGQEAVEQFPWLVERYHQLPETGPNPLHHVIIQKTFERRRWACAAGLKFFDYLERQANGQDIEALVFARPPLLVRWIERPELYWQALTGNRPDLSETLARLEQSLSPKDWDPVQQPWSPEMVRKVADLFNARPRADKVLRGWEEGRSLVWQDRANPRRQVMVGVVRFADADAARSYHGLAIDLHRKQDEVVACDTSLRVLSSRSETVSLPGADEAVLDQKKYQVGSRNEPLAVTTLLARAGNQVIEFSWHGLDADPAWAGRIFSELLPK